MRFVQNDAISLTGHRKKNPKRCHFERHYVSSSSLMRKKQGKKVFLSLLCGTCFTLFPPHLTKNPNPYPNMPCHYDEEKRGELRPASGFGAAIH
jgi:hypothetical protein